MKQKSERRERTSRGLHRVSLVRALSKLGYSSRSRAAEIIQSGAVTVNGIEAKNPFRWIDLSKDKVQVFRKEIQPKQNRVVLLHKPRGVVTTRSDERGRMTVFDVMGEEAEGLVAAGRLDRETSGLLILTNNHRLAEFLTNPESGIEKKYRAKLDAELAPSVLHQLQSGLEILVDGKPYRTKPAKVSKVAAASYEFILSEGKNRQIRRMLEAVGREVVDLKRTTVGTLGIGDLKEGSWREARKDELEALRTLMNDNRRHAIHR
ncbi:MAG: pseudouridine synthase [Bacteroidota bacterium]